MPPTTLPLYTDCRITCLAQPAFTPPAHLPVAWVGDASDGERLAEFAGRNCYQSWHNPAQRTTPEYLANILRQGHGSVLEHANYSFLLEGVSRTFTHELVRHRAGFAYSQLSQRYVDEADVGFVVPPALLALGETSPAYQLWYVQCQRARRDYTALVQQFLTHYAHVPDATHRRKLAREAARSVLPNAAETKVVVTANARAWRTALALRAGEGAEAEMRRWAVQQLAWFQAHAPGFFPDVEGYVAADGFPAARLTHHKV